MMSLEEHTYSFQVLWGENLSYLLELFLGLTLLLIS